MVIGTGAPKAGSAGGLTWIGLVKPEEGKFLGAIGVGGTFGVTGLPGGINGGSISDILVKSSLGKSIGACLN